MAHPFTLVAAVLEAGVFAAVFFFERSLARQNNRPVRRWVLVLSVVLMVAAVGLVVFTLIPT